MSRPTSYQEQSACPTCEHVFIKYEHDEGPDYYCHFDKVERPPCRSVAMGECHDPLDDMLRENPNLEINKNTRDEVLRRSILLSDAWDAWANPRAVRSWGVCGEYVKRRES